MKVRFTQAQINTALRAVQSDLMNGRIKPKEFDMAVVITNRCNIEGGCGTAACIGGHVGLILGLTHEQIPDFVGGAGQERDAYYEWPDLYTKKVGKKLENLFYPSSNEDWSKYTSAQAAIAIERYFNGAKNPWKGI